MNNARTTRRRFLETTGAAAAMTALPATVHIRRALGGPAASLLVAAFSGALLLILPPGDAVLRLLVAFLFWENLLVFFLGAFVPLGFTDGSTLLYWWPRRHEPLR